MPKIQVSGPSGSADVPLGRAAVSIGRDPANTLPVQDGELSRRHCVIEPASGGWQVRDLGSRNGTKVNGEAISNHILRSGDTVQIGAHSIHFVDDTLVSALPAKPLVQAAPIALAEPEPEEVAAVSRGRPAPSSQQGSKGVSEGAMRSDQSTPVDSEEATAAGGLIGRIGWLGLCGLLLVTGVVVFEPIRNGQSWGLLAWVEWIGRLVCIPIFWYVAYLIWPLFTPIHEWYVNFRYGDVVAVYGTEQAITSYKQERWIVINCGHAILALAISLLVGFAPAFILSSCLSSTKSAARAAAVEQEEEQKARVEADKKAARDEARAAAERGERRAAEEADEKRLEAQPISPQQEVEAPSAAEREREQRAQAERASFFAGPPGIAQRNANNPTASSWTDFAYWYYSARFCGGMVFPDAKSAGEAMYQAVDRSTPRGEAMASARRKLAEAEWRFMDAVRHAFPSASAMQLIEVAKIVFGGYFPIDENCDWMGRFGERLERAAYDQIESAARLVEKDQGVTRRYWNGGRWALILTPMGVRIDPFLQPTGEGDGEFRYQWRDAETGQLLPGVNRVGADEASVLRGASPWLGILRDAQALISDPRTGGDIKQYQFLLADEIEPRLERLVPNEAAMERGWMFTLPPLDRESASESNQPFSATTEPSEGSRAGSTEGQGAGTSATDSDRAMLSEFRSRAAARLKALPALAPPTADDLERSSWKEFAEWYAAARLGGGMLFSSAKDAGQAASDIVDSSWSRGKTLAEARRRVAEAEWQLMQFVWDSFQDAKVEDLGAVAESIFGSPNLKAVLGSLEEQSDGQLNMTYMTKNADDGSTWNLIRTASGVRIDPFSMPTGGASNAAHDVCREAETGKLASWVNKDGGTVDRAMKGVESWLETLRAARAIIESGRCEGKIANFQKLLDHELSGRINRMPDAGVLERGWSFSLPPLQKPQPAKPRVR